jgi:hypothetical protein
MTVPNSLARRNGFAPGGAMYTPEQIAAFYAADIDPLAAPARPVGPARPESQPPTTSTRATPACSSPGRR